MALYDDLDSKQRTDKVDGWASGIKLLQTQLALKKTSVSAPRRDPPRKSSVLPPVIDLKSKKEHFESEDIYRSIEISKYKTPTTTTILAPSHPKQLNEYDWDVIDEYDPLWPNDYEKLLKEKRDKEREKNREREDRKRDDRKRGRSSGNSRYVDDSPPAKSGFSARPQSDEDDTYSKSPPSNQSSSRSGAAIAPPPSLQDEVVTINPEFLKGSNVSIPYGSSSVAAKIMAKYGFKDGQGLGKQEQGMSMALQVEKTSKRGGRIIHEKELFMPPPPPAGAPPAAASSTAPTQMAPPEPKSEPSITEIMKTPSKVVLLRNMVGPGDVDNDLEPEVKDECNTKYGEVIRVVIYEIPNVVAEEAVRIFVEFKRIESAIKAVVDLNGRFFGGRQVRAGFYNLEKFQANVLMDYN